MLHCCLENKTFALRHDTHSALSRSNGIVHWRTTDRWPR